MGNANEYSHRTLSLRAITWPLFIELFLQMIMGSTDTIMLSYVSDEAVAAVGVANQIVFFAILIFSFISTGTAVLISQYLGASRHLDAKQAAGISVTINLGVGLLVSVLMVLLQKPMLGMFQLESGLLGMGSTYLTIVGGTLFFQALLVTVSSILRAYQFTREAMFVSIAMNIINLAGNAVAIFLLDMGVQGVAIATAVSRSAGLGLTFYFLYRRLPIKIVYSDYVSFRWQEIKKILRIGLPAAGEQLSYNTSQMAMTAIIALMGAAALTTRVYTWNIMSFILLFGLAIGQGTQILIGYKVGGGDFEGAYRQLLKSLKYSFVITIFIAILISIFRADLLSLFTNNRQIIDVGSQLLLLCLILEPGRTLNIVVINSLRATGDAAFTVIFGVISMWGIAVPASYILGIQMGMGLTGVWIAFIADEWFRGIIMYFRWRSRAWEKKALVDKQETAAS
ncbi:MATE family efflux transporter [Cytobacillus oceanisediminis]|jgi:putative MATE family efflux protein|uniref:MATE family efflux transporter n=1 Tax=Cytobacillus oceanisediminis TaxID=665099 RepID=UPI001C24B0DB|nr:MATE family efflux transporter [Cytobacillus oceanisediminis]MBU8731830.1 MATE family efflux transporter [Cytobacillus oceanisediminis]